MTIPGLRDKGQGVAGSGEGRAWRVGKGLGCILFCVEFCVLPWCATWISIHATSDVIETNILENKLGAFSFWTENVFLQFAEPKPIWTLQFQSLLIRTMLVDITYFKSPRNVVKQSSNVWSSSYVMSVRRFLLVEFSFFFILIVHFYAQARSQGLSSPTPTLKGAEMKGTGSEVKARVVFVTTDVKVIRHRRMWRH